MGENLPSKGKLALGVGLLGVPTAVAGAALALASQGSRKHARPSNPNAISDAEMQALHAQMTQTLAALRAKQDRLDAKLAEERRPSVVRPARPKLSVASTNTVPDAEDLVRRVERAVPVLRRRPSQRESELEAKSRRNSEAVLELEDYNESFSGPTPLSPGKFEHLQNLLNDADTAYSLSDIIEENASSAESGDAPRTVSARP